MPYACSKVGAERKQMSSRVTFASDVEPIQYISTGIGHFDEVLGGGLVEGAVIIIGGKRGAGKTTLLVTLAFAYAKSSRQVLYASAEENKEAVLRVVTRLGAVNKNVHLLGNAYNLDDVFANAIEVNAKLLIIDSLPGLTEGSMFDGGTRSARAEQAIVAINRFCEKTKTCAFIVNHVNRAHEFAGSEKVEHDVTAIIAFFPYFRRDDGQLRKVMPARDAEILSKRPEDVRVLFGYGKNRIGPADVKRFFEMTDKGILRPIPKKTDDGDGDDIRRQRARDLLKLVRGEKQPGE